MTENTLFPELDRSFLLDPFPFYERMRRESPVAFAPESGAYVAFSYEAVKRVLSDYKTFSSRIPLPPEQENFTQSVNFFDPPKHKSIRSLVQQAFTNKRVADMGDLARKGSHMLVPHTVEGLGRTYFLDSIETNR